MSAQQRQCSLEAHGPTEARTDCQTPGLRPILADGHQVGRGNADVDHPRELDSARPGAAFAVRVFLQARSWAQPVYFLGYQLLAKWINAFTDVRGMGFQVPVSKFQGPDLALVNAAWAMSRLVPTRAHSRSATMLVCDLRGEAFYAHLQ